MMMMMMMMSSAADVHAFLPRWVVRPVLPATGRSTQTDAKSVEYAAPLLGRQAPGYGASEVKSAKYQFE